MKILFQIVLLVCTSLLPTMNVLACTNLIVGKNASVDGSVFCTYSCDDYGMFRRLDYYPGAVHSKGELVDIVDLDTHQPHGSIPQASETYKVVGNINEHQVTIGETTFGGREEMVDSTGLFDYGSLMLMGLQRSKTARQAISVMTSLAEKYGYNSEGETFTICDANEAWIMEMMGCGPGSKSVVWVALRVPDDAICAHANQSRIRTFNMKDKRNVLYSKNVVSFAKARGWYSGKDEDFSFCEVYAYPDFGGRRYCEARVWSFFNHFSENMQRYLPYVEGKKEGAEPLPLWIVPNRKVSLSDVMMCMRDHYEGTPFSLDGDIGGGIWEMPYRPTPLSFKCEGKTCFNERPISTQQSAFVYVSQMRSWLPREIGGVMWFCNDDANMAPFTPVYCSVMSAPTCYNTPGVDGIHFSVDNAFWVCNWVSNMVYPRYSQMFGSLQEVRDSLERSYQVYQQELENVALKTYSMSKEKTMSLLTEYSHCKAQQMLDRWKKLAVYLIVKYNDMVVKPENNGKFIMTPYGLPTAPIRPGFSDKYKKELIKNTGDRYIIAE